MGILQATTNPFTPIVQSTMICLQCTYNTVMLLQWVCVYGLSVTHDEAFFYVASKAWPIFPSWYCKTGQTCGAKTWQVGELRYYPLPRPFHHAKHLPASIRCCISSEISNIPRPELLPHQYDDRSITAWMHVDTWKQMSDGKYRIGPNFWGVQFSRIAISKQFMETIFADQEFRVYSILKFHVRNFHGLPGSVKTAKITRLENLDVYGMFFFVKKWCNNIVAHMTPYNTTQQFFEWEGG